MGIVRIFVQLFQCQATSQNAICREVLHKVTQESLESKDRECFIDNAYLSTIVVKAMRYAADDPETSLMHARTAAPSVRQDVS